MGDVPAPDAPVVSVVISSRDRRDNWPALVAALAAQAIDRRFEVVAVDDGSLDATSELLTALADAVAFDLRVVRNETPRGRAGGRNVGWRFARGEVIAFTDDDCLPEPQWLAEGLEALGDGPGRAAIGRTIPDPRQRDRQGPFSRTVEVKDAKYFHTCNAFVRRQDLEATGGLDETFGLVKGGEDTDLGMRLRDLGIEPVFADHAVVRHAVSENSFVGAVREAWQWTGIVSVVRRHPRLRGLLYGRMFWKRSHVHALLVVAAVAGSVTLHPVAAALALPYLRWRAAGVAGSRTRRLLSLPGLLVIDLTEVLTMLRGSVRERVLVL